MKTEKKESIDLRIAILQSQRKVLEIMARDLDTEVDYQFAGKLHRLIADWTERIGALRNSIMEVS